MRKWWKKLTAEDVHGITYIFLVAGFCVFISWRYFVAGFWSAIGGGILYILVAVIIGAVVTHVVVDKKTKDSS